MPLAAICTLRDASVFDVSEESGSKVNPSAKLYAWSDMFDPWHNARDDYYLCNGSWVGAWYGLPREVTVMQWNYMPHEGKSPHFFAAQGFRQIILLRRRSGSILPAQEE